MNKYALKNTEGDFIASIIRYIVCGQEVETRIEHARYLVHAACFTEAEADDIIAKHPETYVKVWVKHE